MHVVRDQYCAALQYTAKVTPMLLPAGLTRRHIKSVLERVHGVFLCGSESNVHPYFYSPVLSLDHYSGPYSPKRDRLALDTLDISLEKKTPVLGICRGLQELNVFMGGTLKTNLFVHKENEKLPRDKQYQPTHYVQIFPGGKLHQIIGKDQLQVNSLHCQGIDLVGRGLTIEAHVQDDGLVEALSISDHPFCLVYNGIQNGFIIPIHIVRKYFRLLEKRT